MNQLDEEKLFYERFWTLHRDPILLNVCEQLGIGVFRRSSVLEGFDEFLREQGFGGKRCLEIGTCSGLTALVLSRYFDEVVTMDVSSNDSKLIVMEISGVKNVRFVEVRDNSEKARVVKGLNFDAAFVDGDHARDTETDFALVEWCGKVLFHEHWEAQPAVMNLVSRLRVAGGNIKTKGKWALWIR